MCCHFENETEWCRVVHADVCGVGKDPTGTMMVRTHKAGACPTSVPPLQIGSFYSQSGSYSLWVKRGGLSLTSVSVTVTVVVPDNPPKWPPMSLAWRTTRYWSWVSLSMSGTAVRRIPWKHTPTFILTSERHEWLLINVHVDSWGCFLEHTGLRALGTVKIVCGMEREQ